ncbi:poly [ADP-ribose] polymerase 1-like [Lineus longissimus]|uniref:poly [ADP-ribose] polymerase 1-like n=1 Tax=Lineus longissimus TaxID=88925 RepID=UPI002B4DE0F4
MADHTDLPYRAEYAKSNRASCKGCKGLISKDTLRLALMVQSPMFDGKIPNWFHFTCFWRRAKPTNPADFHGFDALRWDDQKKIKENINGGGGSSKKSASGGGDAASSQNYKDYSTEYAKSAKSKCRGCQDFIPKEAVRIAKKDYESDRAKMYGPMDSWYHVDCFLSDRDELEFGKEMDITKIGGFAHLRKVDKDDLSVKFGKPVPSKKRKNEETNGSAGKKKKEESEEEKALEKQSKDYWKIRDALHREVSNDALKGLLEYNSQGLASGESKLLDRVADNMLFGALEPCSECKDGQLVYSSSANSYVCTGDATAFTKCMYRTKKPKRKGFRVPEEYKDVEYLKKYKYVKRERVFPKDQEATTSSGIVSSAADGASAARPDKPLHGLKFAIVGKTNKTKAEITSVLDGLGASVVGGKINQKIAAVISTKEEIEKMSKKIKEAEDADVQVVDEGFLDAVKRGGAALMITQHNISSWGSDPEARIGDALNAAMTKSVGKSGSGKAQGRENTHYTKSMPSTMKMTVKGGAAVDPESGLDHSAHVLSEKGDLYTAVLGMVDLVRGTNSYYKLQLLESDTHKKYYVYRGWGRVGTTIGGNKKENFAAKASAMQHFKSIYLEKTGNEWANRKDFEKIPNKFYPLEIDYGQDEPKLQNLAGAGGNSKLQKEIQDFIKMIFDIDSMKKAMLEFEIDLKKMPLGKLSKNQMEKAYKVLTELNNLVDSGGTTTQFLDASNRFYTLIPHDFGMKKPPLLDTKEVIKAKIEMVDNLLEIEVAYNLLKAGSEGGKDPIDVHYEQLKTDMKVLDKKSDEFKRICDYVKNTHGSTHTMYDLKVEEVFNVAREGEKSRFKPFRQLHNRQLLWHGSRTMNFAGILSQGLRIAPPEAPVTGYMFGKGVYFADMVSKSANYCRTSKTDNTGVMLLCEVALGNMHELKNSSFITTLPKGKHSCKGVGMTCPDPAGNYTDPNGMLWPMGEGTDSDVHNSSLLYNEFIVYDTAQINIKYLLKMKFNFKY